MAEFLFNFRILHFSDLPKKTKNNIYKEYYLVIDKDNEVRGAFVLKHHKFYCKNKLLDFAAFQLPLSEGIVNNKYKDVSFTIFKSAFSKIENLFTIGMGGIDNKFPRILKAFGWRLYKIPFFF